MAETMTPEESLRIIQKSISHSRKNLREGSFYYLLWGWALILGSLTNYGVLKYYLAKEDYEGLWWKSLVVWFVFILITILIRLVQVSRSSRRLIVKTHLDRYITTLWISSGVIIALMVFLSIKVETPPVAFILGVTSLATFVSGMMVRFTPLVIGGIIFLVSAVVTIYLPGPEQLLVCAGAMVLGFIIPGFMLRTIKNGEHV